jgi:hypothetical protein
MVLSGDLGASGDAGDLTVARNFLFQPPTPGRPPYAVGPTRGTLGALGKPVVLLPGNHDRYGPLLAVPPYAPGDATFDAVFGAAWGARQGVQELWRGSKDGVSLVLLGADFTLRPGDLGDGGSVWFGPSWPGLLSVWHYGRGRVYDEPLQALQALTRKARKESSSCVVLWVVHFEPDSGRRELELLDDHRLVQAAAEEHVPIILCGHTHHSRVRPLAGGVSAAYVCGTTTQYYVRPPDTNALHILEIDTTENPAAPPAVNCFRYAYNPVRKTFLRDAAFP